MDSALVTCHSGAEDGGTTEMRSKLAALVALSLITAGTAASAQTPSWFTYDGASVRSGESVEGASEAGASSWILIPIVFGTLAALIIAVSVADESASP